MKNSFADILKLARTFDIRSENLVPDETRFNNVNNNLGKDQKNTGLNFAGSVMKGDHK